MDQRPYATMVTNFDSTEQKRSWERLLQTFPVSLCIFLA